MPEIRLSVAFAFLVILAAVPAAAESDEQLAMRFYPQRLDQIFIENHDPESPIVRRVTVARVDLDRSGREDYLAAAYTNGTAGAFRLIKGEGAQAAVAAEAADPTMGGKGQPYIEAIDVENDGVPELAIAFWRETWLYKFRNGALVLFGPSRIGTVGETTNLTNATYLDIDGDGVLEILEDAEPDSDTLYAVHKLGPDGRFARTETKLAYSTWFQRGEGEPVLEERAFEATPGDYILRVTNGDQAKLGAVTAGELRVNGRTVVGPPELKKNERTISVPVRLLESNVLTAHLRSEPGTFLWVTFIRK
ncbi:MAG TPA: VCBS repeat-containing protein [Thermoanaerobaculia bacterium]|nr:VCBS repeat-containing protein [Thermoanaerobaculia bacterium]